MCSPECWEVYTKRIMHSTLGESLATTRRITISPGGRRCFACDNSSICNEVNRCVAEERVWQLNTCGIQVQAAVLDILIYGTRGAQKRFFDVVARLGGRFYVNEA
jgi:hypothetical protein